MSITVYLSPMAATVHMQQAEAESYLNEAVYATLEPFLVQKEDRTLFLNRSQEASGLSMKDYEIILQNIEATNQMITNNVIIANNNGKLEFTDTFIAENPDLSIIENEIIVPGQARAAGGSTKLVQYWWGLKIYLNNSISKNYVAGVTIYNAVRRIAPAGKVEIILSIIATIGAAQISRVNKGNGVIITYNQVLSVISGPANIVYSLASITAQ